MSERIIVPREGWIRKLPEAVRDAPEGATLILATAAMHELAETIAAPDRLNRPDLKFEVTSP